MAASSSQGQDKTVTGYPAPPAQFAAGYPAAAPYPYAAPPPHPNRNNYHPTAPPPPYYNPQPNGPFRRKPTVLCRIIIAAVALFAVMSIISFISWLVLRPQLPEFRVESASVSPLNATSSELTATWDFTLLAANPNHKLTIFYDRLTASPVYGRVPLTTAAVPPFVSAKRNQTRVNFKLATVGEYVGDNVARGIADGKDRGSVRFGVWVAAWVRFKSGVFQSRSRLLQVYCNRVEFTGFARNNGTGTLTGQSSPCEVEL
ncbi:protein YLS9-like [Pyrus ussuriensis x Pyrus communis]|uniref:Protein YLS9-like n=1 Tax=Pyrus ussuriensis x Pyrus communis TaxID=2448454 RepID=A0A5N5G3D8_9ROSA|nr:protein YLS9-like [Pyrus ussuriensis x Pyrus communis]